ncbi:GNAT family N-acetyltransferase [Porticoccus sp.]|uniref:GNAT family N-acetyltransferase n=1 Tax=Porticoccus sp. TaxID=2024853 RepID=UPI003F69FDDA
MSFKEEVQHNVGEQCFFIDLERGRAVLSYRLLSDGIVDFTHTYVPDEYRGEGYAEKLVKVGLDWANQQMLGIQATCWYVRKFL